MKVAKNKLLKDLSHRLIQPDYQSASRFILALSGGVDSMVMLDACLRLKERHSTEIAAVHFNHGTGDFATFSQRLVEQVCEQRGVPCQVFSIRPSQINFEFWSSSQRRELLNQFSAKDDLILLAHHREDQFETVLLSLFRGKGVPGTFGMVECHGKLRRPFLNMPRSWILEYARQIGVPHLLDPTNQSKDQFRGSLRRLKAAKAIQDHGSGTMGFENWTRSYEFVRRPLLDRARVVFDSAFEHADRLPRSVFAQDNRELWPFLLDLFLAGVGCEHVGHRIRNEVLEALSANQNLSLRLDKYRLWIDIDALVLTPVYAFSEMKLLWNKTLQWGPWVLRWDGPRPDVHGPLTLRLNQSRSKVERELFRKNRIPMRFREWLPVIESPSEVFSPHVMAAIELEGFRWRLVEPDPVVACLKKTLNAPSGSNMENAWRRPLGLG